MTARCPWPGCRHAAHTGQCPGKTRVRCHILIDYQTGEPIHTIACTRGPCDPCLCPLETCRCGKPVAVAQLIPGGGYFPVERGSMGAGGLEVWAHQDAMYVRVLAEGEEPRKGRWRGRSHEETCPQAAEWRAERAEAVIA